MGHLIAEAELVNSSCGIAAANDGGSIRLSKSLRNSDGSLCQNRVLEYAHRSVPNNSLGGLYSLCKLFCRLGSDVQSKHICRDRICRTYGHIDVSVDRVREGLGTYGVNRKQQLLAQLLRLLHHFLTIVDLLIVNQRSADLVALSFQEGESHAAADDQGIALLKQVGDYVQLVRNLSSAKDGNKGSYRILNRIAQEVDFLLHQIADNSGINQLSHANVGAVRSMGGSESVVYKYVAEGSQIFGESLSVLGLFRSVTGVLQQDHIAVLHGLNRSFCIGAYHFRIRSELHFLAKQFGKTDSNGSQGQLRLRLSLGFSKMGAQNYLSAVSDQLLNGGKRCNQTVLVGDLSILQRNVEITSAENSFSLYIDIINGFLI